MSKKNKKKDKSNGKKTSPAQHAANQQNAKLSTGPKTPETKAISSKNSLKHGLTSQKFTLLAWEDPEVYEFFKASTIQRCNPQTEEESFWVLQVIQNAWRLQRAIELETQALNAINAGEDCSRMLERFRRYAAGMERSLEKSEQRLYNLRGQENPCTPQPVHKSAQPYASSKAPQTPDDKLRAAEVKAIKAFLDAELAIALKTHLPVDDKSIEARWQKFKPQGSKITSKVLLGQQTGFVS